MNAKTDVVNPKADAPSKPPAEKPAEKASYLTVAALKAILAGQDDGAVLVVDNGTTLCRPVRFAEGFRGRPVEGSERGDAFRLGAGGDTRLVVLTVAR